MRQFFQNLAAHVEKHDFRESNKKLISNVRVTEFFLVTMQVFTTIKTKKSLKIMDRPPKMPDLNPIELL